MGEEITSRQVLVRLCLLLFIVVLFLNYGFLYLLNLCIEFMYLLFLNLCI